MKNTASKNFIIAILISTIIEVVFVAGYTLISQPGIKRLFEMLGGNLPFGVIQYVTYIAFFWAILETRSRMSKAQHEAKALEMQLLPEQEQWVISPNDVNDIKLKMIDLEKSSNYEIVTLIKKACTKFRSNKSVAEVLNVVNTQVELNMKKAESSQSNIRYLAWLIPSLGFIGTVVGIAQSLGLADKATDPEVMAELTNAMEVAFDTTLVALLLSIPVVWYYHRLQETEEILYANMADYVIENLVNRINLE